MFNKIQKVIRARIRQLRSRKMRHRSPDENNKEGKGLRAAIAGYIDEHHKESNWINIVAPLTSILSLAVYLSVGIVNADYKGELPIYILTILVMGIIFILLVREVLCCAGNDKLNWIKSKWQQLTAVAVIIFCGICCINCCAHPKYYSAICEIYGIPCGIDSTSLKKKDLKDHAGYWEIKENKLFNHITLTYVDAYKQTDVMHHYSTLYNMSLFKKPVRIEIDYKDRWRLFVKKKYRAKGTEAFNAAEENKFREPKTIRYYNDSGKLLLEMKQHKDNLLKILTYSPKDAPQLLNSLLFQAPGGQVFGNDMYLPQIEVTYNSAGLPESRRLVSGSNPYGVSGESYDYNSNKQIKTLYFLDSHGLPVCNNIGIMTIDFQYDDFGNLQSICYYSDVDKTEKTDGFSGVFSEKFHYENGNLTERLQLGRSGGPSYDMNTACKYCYTYKDGMLIEEVYYGRNSTPVYIQRDNLWCHSIKYNKKKKFFNSGISISFDLKPPQNSSEDGNDTGDTFLLADNSSYSKKKSIDNDPVQNNKDAQKDDVKNSTNNTDSQKNDVNNDTNSKDTQKDDSKSGTNSKDTQVNDVKSGTNNKDTQGDDSKSGTNSKGTQGDDSKSGTNSKDTQGDDSKSGTNSKDTQGDDAKNGTNSEVSEIETVNGNTLPNNNYSDLDTESNPDMSSDSKYTSTDFLEEDISNGMQSIRDVNRNFCPPTYISIYFAIHKGAVKKMCYFDQQDQPTVNEHGCAVREFKYDNKKRISRESYLDIENNPCVIDEGYAAVETVYASKASGQVRYIKYLDMEKHLTSNKSTGYAVIEYKYPDTLMEASDIDSLSENSFAGQRPDSNKEQEITVVEYYKDQDEQLVLSHELGCAAVKKTYNENGLLVGEAYYDTDGNPVYSLDYGVAQILYDYSDSGNLVCEQYLDINGKPINRLDTGYAVVYREYEMGRKVKEYYEGLQDGVLCAVMNKKDGVAIRIYEYDNGQRTEVAYYDVNHKPVLRSDMGCAKVKFEYENGKNSKRSFYGTSGQLILTKDLGAAVIQYEYDDAGRNTFVYYYGTDGKPVISTKYYCAGFHYNYDSMQTDESDIFYIGLDGNLMIRKDLGYAHVHYDYDDDGRVSLESYWDTDENPILSKEGGFASYTYEYKKEEDRAIYKYYGVDGQHVLHKEHGVARCDEYYRNGKCVERRYYGTHKDLDDDLVLRKDRGYAIIRYGYDEFGRCISEKFFNTKDRLVISTEYQCAGFLYKYDEAGHEKSIQYIGTNGKPFIRGDRGFALVRYEYDQRGQRISSRYYDVDGETLVISTKYHCAGYDYQYDDRGNESEIHYIGLDGKGDIFRRDYGFMWVQQKYDATGIVTGKIYYGDHDEPAAWREGGLASVEYSLENGRTCETRYYDIDHKLTVRRDKGFAVEKNEYDEAGHLILRLYYDAGGQMVFSVDKHCAGFRYAYDEMGNHTDTWCLGTDGNTMFCRDFGYAHVKYEYDEQGRQIQKSFYDVSDKLVPHIEEGYASCQYDYDGQGNRLEIRYYDVHGHLTNRTDTGCAIERYKYDSLNRCILEQYFDVWGEQLVINKKYHCAGFEYEYDNRSRKTDIYYLDTAGKRMIRSDIGISHTHKRYDPFGRLKGEDYSVAHYNDEKGEYEYEPAVWKGKGYSSFTNIYKDGQCIETSYKRDKDYVLRKDTGYARIKREYDEYGQCRSVRYQGTHGQPVFSDQSCAGFRYGYNEKGEQTDTWYLGLDGKPMIRSDKGFAHIHSKYDKMGNEIWVSYLDASEKPTFCLEGRFSICKKNYLNGKCISKRYCNEDEQLIRRSDNGYAYFIEVYEGGKWLEGRYYDENGSSTNRSDRGYAVIKNKYNASGEQLTSAYYDTTGDKAVLSSYYNCAGCRYAYDGRGNLTDTWYIGLDGRPLIDENLGYAHIHYDYNDLSQLIRTSYFDEEDKPITCIKGGYFCREQTYKDGNCIEERYYDINRNLVLRKDTGYAVVKYSYNDFGQERVRTYYGIDGERAADKEGYAGCQYNYDDRGNRIMIWYMDVNGSYERHDNAGGECQYKYYDEYDNLITHEYNIYYEIDADEDRYRVTDYNNLGYAVIDYEYDNTKLISKCYKDENGDYIISPETGYAIVKYKYTYNGMLKSTEYLDVSENPVDVTRSNGKYAKIVYAYDSSGQRVSSVRYNANGDTV